MMETMPSAPALPLGEVVCCSQALGQRSGFPTKAYLMSLPAMVPCVCQPQYCVQNPELAVTSAEVRTKYNPLLSSGSRPLVMALLTTAWTWASLKDVP